MDIFTLAFENIPEGWEEVFKSLKNELHKLGQNITDCTGLYPTPNNIFRAFHLTHLNNVRVIIIGQDPYPSTNKNKDGPLACGLSFSVDKGEKVPGSLINIFKEIKREYGNEFNIPNHGDLTDWAKQGVLLLNSCLTFNPKANENEQHNKKKFWLPFIIGVIKAVKKQNPSVVFMIWGNDANEVFKSCGFTKANALVSAHPSNMAKGKSRLGSFSENDHFTKCNEILTQNGFIAIDWNLS